MDIIIVAFLFIATVVAIGMLVYVGGDIILEKRQKNAEAAAPAKKEEAPAVIAPVIVPVAEAEVFPEIVEYIKAEEADVMISDNLAMQKANYESGAGRGHQAIINIGVLNKYFAAGALVTMSVLKEKKLISKQAGRIKILADGVLEKPLTIKAESYSIQAIKMIELTGGTVIILKD